MRRYLISKEKKQYKANLHCHSTLSDGKKTPEELVRMYKDRGYSILSITDHERPYSHRKHSDDSFIMLTGYEAYIRPRADGKYDKYADEVHLNLFAEDPDNVKHICFSEPYCHYLRRDGALKSVVPAGSLCTREFTVDYINEFIRTAKEHGYIVAYNHPYWSMQREEDILSYEGLFSVEMCNYSSYVTNYLEHSGALYDKMLISGRRVFCHGADDNHNKFPEEHPNSDSFGAFTMIFPRDFSYRGVFDAMREGEMYSSMGPTFFEVSIEDRRVHVECSEVAHIFVYVGSKSPRYLHALPGDSLTFADFEIDERARYVRVSIIDKDGKRADTRGYFPEEW